jgi:hypothetical protein
MAGWLYPYNAGQQTGFADFCLNNPVGFSRSFLTICTLFHLEEYGRG